ncbi:hypothetical protein AB9B48_10225 [Kluyvera ascorbata]|jgi:hypothetical protein|uniref:hypothetical protein n=1 Tax=Kluyvera ascorbata TaxID=51288 RepID=UPI0018A57449|nr:hypothetical protein [Kluyvera ascorbata]BBV65125.1 hypothetical protein STW0522KLE44_15130 [Klebsiella sp. STW0522-44]HEB4874631.1 hypothetical protein [Kluyvera ascorbata F0526]MDT8699884.1 hypothetical protein [Kluyvera ascorbata]MDU3912939.1 hypothetical protein [Kluyvera ascorbata]HCL5620920.1 hypothetical protein [Kluyvera ascorbata]
MKCNFCSSVPDVKNLLVVLCLVSASSFATTGAMTIDQKAAAIDAIRQEAQHAHDDMQNALDAYNNDRSNPANGARVSAYENSIRTAQDRIDAIRSTPEAQAWSTLTPSIPAVTQTTLTPSIPAVKTVTPLVLSKPIVIPGPFTVRMGGHNEHSGNSHSEHGSGNGANNAANSNSAHGLGGGNHIGGGSAQSGSRGHW